MNSIDKHSNIVKNESVQTSTPVKVTHHFLQKTSDGNLMVQNTFQENNNKGTRFLGSKAVCILNKWFIENSEYPYPDETTTDVLAKEADISSKQVKKWFANKRVRSQLCCKPIHRNRKRASNGSSNSNSESNNLPKQHHYTNQNQYPNQEQLDNQYLPSSTTFRQSSMAQSNEARFKLLQQHQQQYFSSLKLPIHSQQPPSHSTSSLLQPSFPFSLINHFNKTNNIALNNQQQTNAQTHLLQKQNQLPGILNSLPLLKSMQSPFYNPMMMMNLLASSSQQQQHHQQQMNRNISNIYNPINNISKCTTNSKSNSTSSAISNSSSSNSNDYNDVEDINDENSNENSLSYENDNSSNASETDHKQQLQVNINDQDQENDVDIDDNEDEQAENHQDGKESSEYNNNDQNGSNLNKANRNAFMTMLMMLNSNYNNQPKLKHQNNSNSNSYSIDEHVSPISPPVSGSSTSTTISTSSGLPFISSSSSASSSSSCPSSTNTSNNNTPNANSSSNKFASTSSSFIVDKFKLEDESCSNTKTNFQTRKSYEKKINFAVISTLID